MLNLTIDHLLWVYVDCSLRCEMCLIKRIGYVRIFHITRECWFNQLILSLLHDLLPERVQLESICHISQLQKAIEQTFPVVPFMLFKSNQRCFKLQVSSLLRRGGNSAGSRNFVDKGGWKTNLPLGQLMILIQCQFIYIYIYILYNKYKVDGGLSSQAHTKSADGWDV